jgi:YVTN family beta-propeller protein
MKTMRWSLFPVAAVVVAVWATLATAEPTRIAVSDGDFDHPHDLVLSPDGVFLYVADLGNDAVKVLDPTTLKTLGAIGEGDLDSPHDVAFDEAGRLLVADSGNDAVVVYEVNGVEGQRLAIWNGEMFSPEGVAPAGGGRVFVTDTGGGGVLRFEDGRAALRKENGGAGDSDYNRPHDVLVDRQGRVLVVDSGNARIQILDQELTLLRSLAGSPYDFNEPKYLAVDEQDNLYVADEYNNQVKILDPDYRIIEVIGTGERGRGPGQLNKPEGVETRDGLIWISDTYNDRILLYRRAGAR